MIENIVENLHLKKKAGQEVHRMTIEIENATEGIIVLAKEIGKEITIAPDVDRGVMIVDGKGMKERLVTERDIATMIGKVIGTGFSEWF